MNTIKDLTHALADEVRRLQPQPGLEARVLQRAFGDSYRMPQPARAHSGNAVRRWESKAPGSPRFTAMVAALMALAIVASLVFAARALIPPKSSPAEQKQISGTPRGSQSAYPGTVTATWGWRSDGGFLMRTDDGGANWTQVTPSGFDYQKGGTGTPLNAYYIDATHAWIVATPQTVQAALSATISVGGPVQLAVLRTEDGGRTWQRGSPLTSHSSAWKQLLKYGPVADIDLFFVDPLHGWLLVPDLGSRVLYTTSDGGLDWKPMARDSAGQGTPCRWSRIAFATLTTGWITDNCSNGLSRGQASPVLVTHDAGATWQAQSLPVTAVNACSSADSECFVDCPPLFGLEPDWYPGAWPGCMNPPAFFDDHHGVLLVWQASGARVLQTLLVTADQGLHWSVRTLPGEYQLEVQFIDAYNGWAVAGSSAEFNATTVGDGWSGFALPVVMLPLYHTADGGSTWTVVPTNILLQAPGYGMFLFFHFVDADHGYANYDLGRSMTTSDGGKTW